MINNNLLIQIDGLASTVLKKALFQNLMPFTQKLIKDEQYKLQTFFCGLPSTTPASQLSLFYGLNNIIPGFRFVMRKDNLVFVPGVPKTVSIIDERAMKKNPKGLLKNGTSVIGIFSGGAESGSSIAHLSKNKKIAFKTILATLNPFTITGLVLKLLALLIIERIEKKKTEIKNQQKIPISFKHIGKRLLHEVIFGQLGYMLTREAVRKKEKIIYVNFSGYDEIAHFYGPESRFALYYLSIIDLYIKGIVKEIKKQNLSYTISIMSDHGQTSCLPYSLMVGKAFSAKVAELFPQKTVTEHQDSFSNTYLHKSDLYILNSGGLSLIYDLSADKPVNRTILDQRYPGFCEKVSLLPHIAFVIVKNMNGKTEVVFQGKTLKLEQTISDNFLHFIEPNQRNIVISQLKKLFLSPYSADVYVIGDMINDHQVTTFEDQQKGTHGSLGGQQTESFFLSKDIHLKNIEQIENLSQIYNQIYPQIYIK